MLERLNNGQYRVQCDGCLRGSPVVHAAEQDLEQLLGNMGWARVVDHWACPICQSRTRSRSEPMRRR
jgi:hypothetical protein